MERPAVILPLLIVLLLLSLPSGASASLLVANPDSAQVAGKKHTGAASKLAGAIRFRTISDTDQADAFASEFVALHAYLRSTFPAIHENLQLEVVNKRSLLYTWPGGDPLLKPVLLSAHLDVVPVEGMSADEWVHGAFSGFIDDTNIWGRGTQDDKYRVIAIMEAVEQLILNGFSPKRTILLAFGHDEETGGTQGAGAIGALLKERYDQLEAVFDEGLAVTMGIFPGINEPIAFVGTASKGSVSFKLTVNGAGGHSSVPPDETPISILSQAIVNIGNRPFRSSITPLTRKTLSMLADELGGKSRFAMKFYGLFKGVIKNKLEKNIATDALIRTKVSPTIVHAGEKDNVLPREATAVLNVRILTGENGESVRNHIVKAINDERVQVTTYGYYSPPSSVATTETWTYQALQNTITSLFPEALVVPALFPGGTDARHYAGLTDNIYLFAPVVVTPDVAQRVHNVNERLSLKVFDDCILFYSELLRYVSAQEEYLVHNKGLK